MEREDYRQAPARVLIVDDAPGVSDVLGMKLEREGYVAVVAASAERANKLLEADEFDVILQGTVAGGDVTNPTFKILGVTVDTSMLDPNNDFEDLNDSPMSPTAFFNALTPNGGLVKAKGGLPPVAPGGNVLAAGTLRGVELED